MSSEYYNVNNSANCSSTRWLTEEVFKLIDIVQKDEAIYNPRHKYYFCRPYVENFWREVDLKLEKNPGASLAKWTNLRISFRREYTNYLEEKLPPCWTYFDRMFFLHPFLRKKQPQPKSLDSQVQDALVHINSLTNRLQRDHLGPQIPNAANLQQTLTNSRSSDVKSRKSPQHIDNYLEYFDNSEQNNSEIDDMIENEEQTERFPNMDNQSINNDIKSECEDGNDDYEETLRCRPRINFADEDHENDEALNFAWDSNVASSISQSTTQSEKRVQQQNRLQHLQRIQTRSYHEELRAKRPRSNESISSTISCQNSGPPTSQRLLFTTHGQSQPNVSFVRPTFNKSMDVVSTTTVSNNPAHSSDINDLPSTTVQTSSSSGSNTQIRHLSHIHPRTDSQSNGIGQNNVNTSNTPLNPNGSSSAPTHLELCDCKTDPDAMFLMSLLPDIQKLNGRDRGKIKIAFQNILQDYLYPD